MTEDDIVITVTDCRDVGFCVLGAVDYLKQIGLDFRTLRNGGYTVGDFRKLEDANATIVLRRAIERSKIV